MKLKITTEQYKTILIREQQERLSKKQLNENDDLVLMGFSKIIGVPLSNQNKRDSETALNNPDILLKIKDVFNDKSKLDSMVKTLEEEKGMSDVKSILSKNAQKFITKFNDITKKDDLGSDAFTNLTDLA